MGYVLGLPSRCSSLLVVSSRTTMSMMGRCAAHLCVPRDLPLKQQPTRIARQHKLSNAHRNMPSAYQCELIALIALMALMALMWWVG